jgi:transcription antitermination factor NusG
MAAPAELWRGDSVSYWAVARLEPHRERLALHCLTLAGFTAYYPRLRDWRIRHGRRIEVRPPLFPGYCFFMIEAQWHSARWSVGVIGLIMGGIQPARVPDSVIAEIRCREGVDGSAPRSKPRGASTSTKHRAPTSPTALEAPASKALLPSALSIGGRVS